MPPNPETSFFATPEDNALIHKILDRVQKLARDAGIEFDRGCFLLDLRACHANGTPMDWQRLLDADDFNLAHDVWGIHNHIERAGGTLRDSFRPRFARKDS